MAGASCDLGSKELHIDPEAAEDGNGSSLKPYISIMEAFDEEIAGKHEVTNFCLKLYIRDTAFALNSANAKEEFKHFSLESPIQKIHMLAWDPSTDTESSIKAVINYQDPYISWEINSQMEFSFSHITFKDDLVPNWNSEIWRHCHYKELLKDGLTGTGQVFQEETGFEQQLDVLGDINGKCTQWGLEEENSDLASYGLFHIAASGAMLRMQDCLFTEFRFRASYIINISRGGSVSLTNVDFENMEPGKYGHEQQQNGGRDWQKARGVITAFAYEQSSQSATGIGSMGDNELTECRFDDRNPYEADSNQQPKPCGAFTWDGGNVTGLNRDVNLGEQQDDKVQYFGFLDLRHLQDVDISNVDFTHNIIPVIYSEQNSLFHRGIVEISYWSRIQLTSWSFENNMAQKGAVYIYYDHDLWQYNIEGDAPYDLYSVYSEVITIDQCVFDSNTQFSNAAIASGLTILTNLPVNIEIKNSSFINNNSAWSSAGALYIESNEISTKDSDGLSDEWNQDDQCYENEYYDDQRSMLYWNTGKYLKLTSNVFNENYTGSTLKTRKWANVLMQSNTFTHNTYYNDYPICEAKWPTIQKFIDSNRIQPHTGNNGDEDSLDCNGFDVPSYVGCELIISTKSIYGIRVVQGNEFKNNVWDGGPVWFLKDHEKELYIEDAIFEKNLWLVKRCGLNIRHYMSYTNSEQDLIQIPEIKNVTFLENTLESQTGDSTSLKGSACINGNDYIGMANTHSMRLKITSCTFTRNKAWIGAAIYWPGAALIINDSKFEENQNECNILSEGGGTVHFDYNLDTRNDDVILGEFTISQCTFRNNVANYVPDVLTKDQIAVYESYLVFRIVDWLFQGSVANFSMGSIQIGQHNFLQESDENSSYISNSVFSWITMEHGLAAIYIQHLSGALVLSNLTFDGLISNQISCGVEGSYRHDDSIPRFDNGPHTYVKLKNSLIQNCDCGNFIRLVNNQWRMYTMTENLTVQNNTFNFAYIENSHFYDTGSTFQQNTANYDKSHSGTILYGTQTSEIRFNSTQFKQNMQEKYGGVVYLSDQGTTANFYNITAEDNIAYKGGFLYAQEDSIIEIDNSKIRNNTAQIGSAIYLIQWTLNQTFITNTEISYNMGFGVIYQYESILFISQSIIHSNSVQDLKQDIYSPSIVQTWGIINSQDNEYRDQIGLTGAFLLSITQSQFIDTGSKFSNGTAKLGGIGYLISSNVILSHSIVENMSAGNAGLFYATLGSNIDLIDTKVYNSTSTAPSTIPAHASIIYSTDANVKLVRSAFNDFRDTGIQIFGENNELTIKDCNFTNGITTGYGGAVQLENVPSFQLTGSRFENLVALQGGAIYFEGTQFPVYTIFNNTFTDCIAHTGGAIYSTWHLLNLDYNIFLNNSALDINFFKAYEGLKGHGGAIYHTCAFPFWNSNFTRNTFIGNRADLDGGGVKWVGVEPNNLVTNNTYDNNTAIYGNDFASTAISMKLITEIEGRVLINNSTSITDVASGQNVPSTLCIGLFDHYENLVATQDQLSCQLLPVDTNTTTISGEIRVIAQSGIFWYDEFKIVAQPGTSVQIQALTALSASSLNENGGNLNIDVHLRECISGESLIAKECFVCGVGSYSLDPQSSTCQECPQGAVCYGNNTLAPKKGYWRNSNATDSFFIWPFYNAWLGGEKDDEVIWSTGRCELGYEGNKCQAWSEGYSRVGKNECYECPNQVENIMILTLIVLCMVIGVTLMVKSTLASANKPQALHSVYMRIFVNYLQVIMLMISFQLQWPVFVYQFLSYQETAGSVTGQIYSLDCLTETTSDVHPYYSKSLIVSFLPIIVILISCTFWGVAAVIKRRKDFLKRQLVSTIIVVLFLVHPIVVKSIFALFACTEIEKDEWWLIEQMDLRCWDNDHIWYILTIFLPAVILWGFGIPFLALTLLVRNRRNLQQPEVRLKYGFLFIGYQSNSFYWILVIIARKIGIAFVSVFFANISTAVQGLIAFLVLNISLLLQVVRQPYDHPSLNKLETFSIVTAGTTIYWGLFYLSESIDEITSIFLFIIILLSNFVFIFYWSKLMIRNMVIKVMGLFMLRKVRQTPDLFDSYDSTDHIIQKTIDFETSMTAKMKELTIEARPSTPTECDKQLVTFN